MNPRKPLPNGKGMLAAGEPAEKSRLPLGEQARVLVSNLDTLFHRLLFPRAPVEPEVELSRRDVRSLWTLAHRGALNMSDFAEALDLPVSTATHIVDRLVKKSLVIRRRSESDRRVVEVELSQAGNRLERTHLAYRLAMARDMLKPLTPGEREIFLELMEKMSRLATLDRSGISEDQPAVA
ncbi:MAG: MarR family transcriptional regulator, partial [Acidobacteriaceae bacterium]|nr:MarR family transcriptional regulator [Acidobacteriaceae bacterium]